jgi:hypothetical protein
MHGASMFAINSAFGPFLRITDYLSGPLRLYRFGWDQEVLVLLLHFIKQKYGERNEISFIEFRNIPDEFWCEYLPQHGL